MRKRLEYRLHGKKALEGTVDSVIGEIIRTGGVVEPHVCSNPSVFNVSYANAWGKPITLKVASLENEPINYMGFALAREDRVLYMEALDDDGRRRLLGHSREKHPLFTVTNDKGLLIGLDRLAFRIRPGDQSVVLKCDGKDLATTSLRWGSPPEKTLKSQWPERAVHETYADIDNRQPVSVKNLGESTFKFTKKVDGAARVLVVAPKSTVTFSTPPSGLFGENEGSKIDGNSTVLLVANSVDFHAKIDSDQARVFIILAKHKDKPRQLRFLENIGAKTKVYWCTEDGTNADSIQGPKNAAERAGNVVRVGLSEMLALIRSHGFVGQGLLEAKDMEYLHWYLTERDR